MPLLRDDFTEQLLTRLQRHRTALASLSIETKDDGTFLTTADLDMEGFILGHLKRIDPTAEVISEEAAPRSVSHSGRVWIVDPIDGTSQFIETGRHEFCIALGLYVDGEPREALIVAPELGQHRNPVTIHVVIDHNPSILMTGAGRLPWSTTGSVSIGGQPDLRDRAAKAARVAGRLVKEHTTSQTVDIVRTCLRFKGYDDSLGYDAFIRFGQHLWDGAPGYVLAHACGMTAVDAYGDSLVPLRQEHLDARRFDSSLLAHPSDTGELIAWAGHTRRSDGGS